MIKATELSVNSGGKVHSVSPSSCPADGDVIADRVAGMSYHYCAFALHPRFTYVTMLGSVNCGAGACTGPSFRCSGQT
jgi:hypothetical protein